MIRSTNNCRSAALRVDSRHLLNRVSIIKATSSVDEMTSSRAVGQTSAANTTLFTTRFYRRINQRLHQAEVRFQCSEYATKQNIVYTHSGGVDQVEKAVFDGLRS